MLRRLKKDARPPEKREREKRSGCSSLLDRDVDHARFYDHLGTYLRLVSFAYGRRCLDSTRTMALHAVSAVAALFFCKSQLRGHKTKHIQEKNKFKKKKREERDKQKQRTGEARIRAGSILVKNNHAVSFIKYTIDWTISFLSASSTKRNDKVCDQFK